MKRVAASTTPLLKRPKAGGASGFALLEATVAAALISFGVLAISTAQLTQIRHAEVATQRTLATQWAQQKLEALRFEHASSLPGMASLALTGGHDEPHAVGNTTYLRRWLLPSPGGETRERPVMVTVAWHDRAGRMHDVTLATVLLPTDASTMGLLTLHRPSLNFF